ncbi:MAG: hypothetical protein DRJ62_04165 [Thermoprotei archaeon]|nr:MAG: hypothetical protein DRJ62_04165 [Thermoprotei archaeon]
MGLEVQTLCIFEDQGYSKLFPLTYVRAPFELVCGFKTLMEMAVERIKPSKTVLVVRDYLRPKVQERYGLEVNDVEVEGDTLLLNGRVVLDDNSFRAISELRRGQALVKGDVLLALKVGEGVARGVIANRVFRADLAKSLAEVKQADLEVIEHPWDLIELTPKLLGGVGVLGKPASVSDEVKVLGDFNMFRLGGDVEFEGPIVIDVRGGPVYIADGCRVEGFSRIEGPTYVGRGTVIRGAYVRSGCFIGSTCRIGVGSELESTVVLNYTNKQHLGLIAHSYIGEWVNIGAGTNSSDLKNTYGTVRVKIGDVRVDTGLLKVGCFIGDFAKTSIGTQIYTGKRIGVFSHVHGFVLDDVPPFTLWAKSLGAPPTELTLESALETQRRMFARRGVSQTRADVELAEALFKVTAQERDSAGVVKGVFSLA